MPENNKRYPSRTNRRNRSNSVLNLLIGLVFALIVITVAFIFIGDDEGNVQEPETVTVSEETESPAVEQNDEAVSEEGTEAGADEPAETDEEAAQPEDGEKTDENAEEESTVGGTITREESDDPVVLETIVNTSWEPIGTEQTGDHVSSYDGSSIDWQEKIDAISYATGLDESNMTIWRIGNGGGPQRSIGVVSSKDRSENFRVYLNWVDGEGWKPEKMDILKTVEGAY